MESNTKKRWLIGTAVYVGAILLILTVSNLGAFNDWLGRVMLVLRPLLVGLILAYLLNPLFRMFERKVFYKIHPPTLRRVISLTLTYLALLLIIVILLMLIVPQLVQSILDFTQNANATIDSSLQALNDLIFKLNGMLPQKENGQGMIPPLDPIAIKASFGEFMKSLRLDGELLMSFLNTETLGTIFSFAGNFVSIITDTIFGLFISLYLLHTKERRYAQLMRLRRAVFSDSVNAHITRVCTTADRSFGGFLKGKILDSSMVGVLVYVAISIIGVPYAILIAVIVAITDIVPVIGPFIGVIPAAIIILLTDPSKVIPFVLCILVVQQIDGNIIAPKILGENTGVSSLCVIIAITTMGTLWGLAGMVLGVPLFATVLELTSSFLNKKLQKKGLSTETDDYYNADGAEKESESDSLFERIRNRRKCQQTVSAGGAGDLNAFERFSLDTYELARKHHLFSENSEEIFEQFAAEEAELAATAEEEIIAEEQSESLEEEATESPEKDTEKASSDPTDKAL